MQRCELQVLDMIIVIEHVGCVLVVKKQCEHVAAVYSSRFCRRYPRIAKQARGRAFQCATWRPDILVEEGVIYAAVVCVLSVPNGRSTPYAKWCIDRV